MQRTGGTSAQGRRGLATPPNEQDPKGASAEKRTQNPPAEDSAPAKPEPSFTTSTSEAASAANAQPLPYLSRALGVERRPTSETASWGERHPEWFDRDARLRKRKQLWKSLYFPDVKGTCLADRSTKHTSDMFPGRVSIVAILTSKVSEEHTRSFYVPSYERFRADANFQLVQINLQENALKAYLLTLFMSTLRSQVPKDLQSTYLLSHQNMDNVRGALALDNKHVGYTYLVGTDGKIRWAGCGFAEPDEARALVACTGVLLDRAGGRRRT
ncbi:Mitochondrial ATPase complex subunit atp10 [Malassezia sp. CBS 17886]|nr:Mitochondrial ATPase complex subunit atp10 [Malassezia sp. CBS 17886]